MTDQDTLFDWRTVKEAARESQRPVSRRGRAVQGMRQQSPASDAAPSRGQMIAFPLSRRRDFVERLAAQVAARPTDAGEFHLLRQLDRQRDVLARKGIPEKTIERELRALSGAVRAELWLLLLGGKA
jgi:hypothetical protein